MLKIKKLIKNTLSKLHRIHQRRGVLKTPSSIYDGNFSKKQPRTFCRYLFLQKTPSQKSGWVPNTCHKTVVRKFPMYKLKQKRAKKS